MRPHPSLAPPGGVVPPTGAYTPWGTACVRIVISEFMDQAGIAILRRRAEVLYAPGLHREPVALRSALADADALVVRNETRVDRELLRAATRLRVVGRLGSGLDNVDLRAAAELGIPVVYAPEAGSDSVAEFTLALLLCLARRIPAADRDTRQGGWAREAFMGTDLAGKTLGVLGFGRIGRRVAVRASALGMEVLAYHPRLPPGDPAWRRWRARPVGERELFARADALAVHLPLTPETQGYLNRERLAWLKPGALLVSVGRGEVVDEAALAEALRAGHLAGAALDVRTREPPPQPDPLAELPNTILTPHIAAFTAEAQRRAALTVARDVLRVLEGRTPLWPAAPRRPR